ncbi:MAG: cytochrome c oxidase subunit II [Bauldia sp.]|nr:cytochrome c oxidase subunit II [Bauldia sp.]
MDEKRIVRSELRWVFVVAAAVTLMLVVIVATTLANALHPPSNVETIDPATLHIAGEFTEANLGTQENADGTVTVRLIATQYAFVPRCLPVPEGRPVSIRVTSPDVIHGFIVAGTNANTMVVPGFVAELTTEFDEPGDHLMPCHEYCGLGHSNMWAVLRVVPEEEWIPDANGRMTCELVP